MRLTSMKSMAAAALLVLGAASISHAQESAVGRAGEISVLGGLQVLNSNDTALPDDFVNVPLVAGLAYHLSPVFAVEGEFTWMVPVEQEVEVTSGTNADRKTPDILAYQGNLRATWPGGAPWAPYATAGLGGVTFLSNTDADRLPALADAQSMFAVNFGAGLHYALTPEWGVRADFRELVAFPGEDNTGLSSGGDADPIWMERGTVGLSYRF